METKLERFRALVEIEQRNRLIAEGYQLHNHNYSCHIKVGRKYANVDVGGKGSGRYMVELTTGNIYGIKAYGVIHRGHAYGTLDTIHDWDWSGYAARPVPAAIHA